MKKTYLLAIITLLSFSLFAQDKYTISGYVTDKNSGESLIGATVVDLRSGKGTVTNTYGFYSLTLPSDSISLGYSYVGYQTTIIPSFLQEDKSISVSLDESLELTEVKIVADANVKIEDNTQMSTIKVPVAQLKKIPALLGETDILKALQLLPGVQSGGEGQSGLYVRGGSPDQNLILLDGTPVYNANHLFGFFSVFNADAIKDVNLVKGGFPARYGGRLSSVLEINMKEGNNQSFHGSGTIGLVSSKLTLEGPIIKDKASFIVSGRRTYIDILARPLINYSLRQSGQDGKIGYYFYDLNAKLNYKLNDKNRFYLSAYSGDDKFYTEIGESEPSFEQAVNLGLGWGNFTAAARWNHLWTDKLFSNLTATYSRYNFGTDIRTSLLDREEEPTTYNEIYAGYSTGIFDYALKLDFDYLPSARHFVRFGAQGIYHTFNPNELELLFDNQIGGESVFKIDTSLGQPIINSIEYNMYVEDDIEVTDKLKVNAGLHFSGFNVNGADFTSLQPRLSARYKLPGDVAIKGSFATMQQYIQYLTNESLGLPWDQWLPTTDRVGPQTSWQAAAGFAKTFPGGYDVSIEGYYKKMDNITAYAEGASLFNLGDWQDQVVKGEGRSYGAEFFVQKKTGKLSGWVGYTLSWSDRRFDDKNFGEWYPFTFDRRHDVSVVAIYEVSDRISLSGTWVYGTGRAYTLATSQYLVDYMENFGFPSGSVVDANTERNNYRLAPYHRLDVNADFTWGKKRIKHKLSIGAYNAYSRKNPFFLNIEEDYDPLLGESKKVLRQYSLFPIIPSIAYSFSF